mmetsp:Transcript_28262/g.66412  ORF Transcript_28262/g.66412 Transcript_28262/m.66412 type:complete len:217 (+) Transcript_28262:2270-2920(+)
MAPMWNEAIDYEEGIVLGAHLPDIERLCQLHGRTALPQREHLLSRNTQLCGSSLGTKRCSCGERNTKRALKASCCVTGNLEVVRDTIREACQLQVLLVEETPLSNVLGSNDALLDDGNLVRGEEGLHKSLGILVERRRLDENKRLVQQVAITLVVHHLLHAAPHFVKSLLCIDPAHGSFPAEPLDHRQRLLLVRGKALFDRLQVVVRATTRFAPLK